MLASVFVGRQIETKKLLPVHGILAAELISRTVVETGPCGRISRHNLDFEDPKETLDYILAITHKLL